MEEITDDGEKIIKMGASTNVNANKLNSLQERKKNIEESLAKCNRELRELCIQEADLTGTVPLEMPLQAGESPPIIRRRVGTAYQLPENLIKNTHNKDESIAELELQIQIQANMAEAALGLANEQNISKTVRRQHMSEYQQHKMQYGNLQEKLSSLKDRMQQKTNELPKQKKKPRPIEQINQPITSRQRSERCSIASDLPFEQSYPINYKYYKSPNYSTNQIGRSDDNLTTGVYRLSLNGYKNYMERHENGSQQYSQYKSHSPQLQSHYTNRTSINYPISKQSSPNLTNKHAYYSHTMQPNYYNQNPHQIQPHQQYEQNVMVATVATTSTTTTTAGLGGYWKQTENGEMIWCNNSDSTWQRDKRFGSLDRRKNRRLQKRISPSIDNKSATLSGLSNYPVTIKSHTVNRRSQDNRQLVRTQSLGSVGLQTVDNVWPSDDNSSCGGSDNHSITDNHILRKPKQKEWLETSLDAPVSPTQSILSPEDKYFTTKMYHLQSLEIPAESNPSPRIAEKNLELINNNIPKNCTIVQAGHCKPYHEETKPFEMSDFYKYSTKFKKSPVKSHVSNKHPNVDGDDPMVFHQKLMKNANFDTNQLSPTHVAEHFSEEMNAWYKNNQFHEESTASSTSKIKSTATLV